MEKWMRNKILEKTDEIIEIIKNSKEYQQYIEISNKMKDNKEIVSLINDIKKLQQKLVKEQSVGNDITVLDKEINDKLKILEEYPIYLEYLYLQEDLNNSINLIKESIEDYINNITN